MDSKFVAAAIVIVVLAASTGYFAYAYSSTNSNLSSEKSSLNEAQLMLLSAERSQPLALAMSHWNEIAIENVSAVMSEYASNATLHWVGGPLTGVYSGTGQISSTWSKFTSLYEAVFWYAISPPSVTKMGGGYEVSAQLQFVVSPFTYPIHTYILNVTETLVYSPAAPGYALQNETWSVKPLDFSVAVPGYPTSQALETEMALSEAYGHYNAIGIENASLITSEYSANATLAWLGGPLTGNYTGPNQINQTWTKFSNLYEYVVWYAINPPSVTIGAASAKVVSYLQFLVFPFPTSSNPTPHSLVLNVTDTLTLVYSTSTASWQVQNEVWMVHPISVSSVAPGYSQSEYS